MAQVWALAADNNMVDNGSTHFDRAVAKTAQHYKSNAHNYNSRHKHSSGPDSMEGMLAVSVEPAGSMAQAHYKRARRSGR